MVMHVDIVVIHAIAAVVALGAITLLYRRWPE